MKSRLILFVALLVLWTGGVGARLYRVQVVQHKEYADRAIGQQQYAVDIQPPRGSILDRRGRTLAISVAVESACLFPRKMANSQEALDRISEVISIDRSELARRVSERQRFVWLARQLDPEQAEALRALEIEGLEFVQESKRYYPMGTLAAPVLGFVGTDHTGLAGLEAQYEKTVSGRAAKRTVIRDALNGRVLAPGLSITDAEPGSDVRLTLDASIQHVVERELSRSVEEHSAKSGMVVLLQPATGAVLAMASYPSFDPNRFQQSPPEYRRNRAIQDVFEPGSTFKLVTAAAALDHNVIDPVDTIDCEQGAIQLERVRIRDHKPFGMLSFREVFAKSSNVGAIKTGGLVGREGLYRQILDFGFGRVTGVDLPGEQAGLMRPVERWERHADAYAAIGQGISVTALQLVSAFGAIANGGELPVPFIVRDAQPLQPADPLRVAEPATVRTLVRFLESVVEEGTGRRAAIPGYRAAGKTGTAQKATPGRGYSEEKHVASFAGFAPSRDPAIAAVIIIDEPQGENFHGGDVAAPVFSAILSQVLPYLGIAPDDDGPSPVRTASVGGEVRQASQLERSVGPRQVARARDPRGVLSGARTSQRMPDLAGLTARQAVWVASELGFETEMNGSGRVEAQAPPAGVPLERAGEELQVWLSMGL